MYLSRIICTLAMAPLGSAVLQVQSSQQSEIYDELVENIVSASKEVKVGDAFDPDVYMGPVISQEAKKKIENYIDIGINEGARLVLDGRNPKVPEKNKNGYFVGPTVFVDVDEMRR